MKIEFWWRQIFEILIMHKPSLWSLDVPQKIWARSVQPFWRLLDTNKQTPGQTDKPNLYIDCVGETLRGLFGTIKAHLYASPLALDPIRVQSCVCCLFWTNMAVSSIYLSIYLIIQLEMNPFIGTNQKMEIFTSTETIVKVVHRSHGYIEGRGYKLKKNDFFRGGGTILLAPSPILRPSYTFWKRKGWKPKIDPIWREMLN